MRELRTLLCADWFDHGRTAGLGEPAPRNLVYSGSTDDLRLNRHFFLEEKIKKVVNTNQKSFSTIPVTFNNKGNLFTEESNDHIHRMAIFPLMSDAQSAKLKRGVPGYKL